MDRGERRFPDALAAFGKRVYDHLEELNGSEMVISREDLAERSGLHVTYISRLVQGRTNPSLDVILRIADALELDPGELTQGLLTGAQTGKRKSVRRS
jgi:transcriptional regulator with XRE-family HTH domain